MRKTLAGALAMTAVAVLGGAPGAAADSGDVPRLTPPDLPFPSDRIEHRVMRHCGTATGIYARFNTNGCLIADVWITSDRDRAVYRNADSGKVVAEFTTVGGTVFSWVARTNELVVAGGRPNRPSHITRAAEAEMIREALRRGWYRVAAEEVRDGRAVHVLTDNDRAPADNAQSTVVVDKSTYEVLERSLTTTDGKMTARDALVSVEQLPRTAANERLLQMTDRPGVAVRRAEGEDAVLARAARKAGLRKSTRAKIRRKAAARQRARR